MTTTLLPMSTTYDKYFTTYDNYLRQLLYYKASHDVSGPTSATLLPMETTLLPMTTYYTASHTIQLRTTSADLLKMIPMAVFIIVPFMEFALPIALYLFPNILPSTFKHEWKKEEELRYAKYL